MSIVEACSMLGGYAALEGCSTFGMTLSWVVEYFITSQILHFNKRIRSATLTSYIINQTLCAPSSLLLRLSCRTGLVASQPHYTNLVATSASKASG